MEGYDLQQMSLPGIELYMACILTSWHLVWPLAPLLSYQVVTLIHIDPEIRFKQTGAKPLELILTADMFL